MNTSALISAASSGFSAYLREQLPSSLRAGAAVEVLVRDGDEAFVEERIALTRDLHPSGHCRSSCRRRLFIVRQYRARPTPLAAGRGIDTYDLLVAARVRRWESPAP